MKRYTTTLIIVLCVLIIIAACAPAAGGEVISADKKTDGGDEQNTSVNIKELKLSENLGKTVIDLSFATEAGAGVLPKYTAYCLPLPERFVLKFENITATDYLNNEMLNLGSIMSNFYVLPDTTHDYSLYFQLKEQCDYSIQEEAGKLSITLIPNGKGLTQGSVAVLSAFSEFSSGQIPEDAGLTPTLCSDLSGLTLISKPYATEEEAIVFAEQLSSRYASVLNGKKINTMTLAANELPDYEVTAQSSVDLEIPSVKKNGAEIILPAAVSNGKYLAETPDGKILFARIYEIDEQTDEQGTNTPIVTRIYTVNSDGAVEETSLPEFTDVESAIYSPSGRYIAILDIDGENRILYMFDTQTGSLSNLGEEGLGNLTIDFDWDNNRDIVYSISGSYDALQLMQTDMQKSNGKISAVEERQMTQGRVDSAGGNLYVSDIDSMGNEKIYRYNFETNQRETIADGLIFEMSYDAEYAAVMRLAAANEEEGEIVDLVVYDLKNKSSNTVLSKASITSFMFSPAGKLYIANGGNAVDNDKYETVLQVYDTKTNKLIDDCQTLAEVFNISPSAEIIYLPVFVTDNNLNYYVTYVYDPAKY